MRSKITATLSLIFLAALVHRCSGQTTLDYEAELIKYLKTNITSYSPLLYPKLNRSSIVYVNVRSLLGRLVSVESANQSVKVAVFMDASWDDERLVWNPANFGGVNVINWESSQVWFPVILIYNGIGDSQLLTPQIPVYLASNSLNSTTVTASWRREFEFSCRFEMSKFPQDEQTCELEFFFSDQGLGKNMVRPIKTIYDFDELAIYQASSEWTMLSAKTFATERSYKLYSSLPPKSMPTYILQIKIKRVSNYYVMNVVIPLLLLALLQSVVFSLLPVNCDEKLGFGITIMLSYTVFLLLMDKILPKSESMPGIGIFIIAAITLSTVSLLFASLSKRLYFTPKGTRMPGCVRAVAVRFLARMLCVTGTGAQVNRTSSEEASSLSSVKAFSDDTADEGDTSDWVTAAFAVERLTMAMCILATAVIIGLFLVKPYA